MNGKVLKSSQLTITVAAVLALSSMAPLASAKTSSDAIIGTGRTDAIIGTGRTDAIIGTGRTDAIIGTGRTDAIIGTGRTDAIIGTGRTDAIIGTGRTDAIIGTGKTAKADAIIGTGRTDAIIGTGRTDAIIGTGRTDAIIGTGRATSESIDAIIGTGKQRLLLVGPIDSVSAAEGTVKVMGKSLAMASTRSIAAGLAAGSQLTVMVTGDLDAKGGLKDASFIVIGADYVPGASRVAATGRVTEVHEHLGTLSIGSVVVDFTGTHSAHTPKVGDVVAVVGVQPARGGIVLAERIGIR